jgi:alkanesulfonate monooxygenase SsuD/methylene tetrahydromethanopterin reductase-like flavin-dependent oxidoreductase (luciferase family)
VNPGIGIAVEGQEGLNWGHWRSLCVLTESLGFDSLWRSDHLQSVIDGPERDCLEAWTSLALAAEWTRRIEFGPLVTPMTFRAPTVLARMAASVDVLSSGRLVLGLGAGWNEPEHAAFGLTFESTPARLAALERGIGEIKRIHKDFNPKPARNPIPILIGGSGLSKSVAIAARCADEYNAGELTPVQFAECSDRIDRACQAISRPPDTLNRSVTLHVLVAKSERDLRTKASKLGQIMPEHAQRDADEILGVLRAQAPGPWVVGTPEQIKTQLTEYFPHKPSRLILTVWLLDDIEESLELLSRTITPRAVA